MGRRDERCMIVAQVCLGRSFRALQAMPRGLAAAARSRPGLEEGSAFEGEAGWDSILGEETAHGGVLDHREYVVLEDAQTLPRYLIWYRHSPDCCCHRCSVADARRRRAASADHVAPGSVLAAMPCPDAKASGIDEAVRILGRAPAAEVAQADFFNVAPQPHKDPIYSALQPAAPVLSFITQRQTQTPRGATQQLQRLRFTEAPRAQRLSNWD